MAKARNNKVIEEKEIETTVQSEESTPETESVASLLGVTSAGESEDARETDDSGVDSSTDTQEDTDGVSKEDSTDTQEENDSGESKPEEEAEFDVDGIDAKVNAIINTDDNILSKIRKVSDLIPSDKGGKLMKSLVYLFSNRIKPDASVETVVSEQKSFVRLFKQFNRLQQAEFNIYFKYFIWAYKSLLNPEILKASEIGLIRKLSPLDSLNIIQYCGNSKDSVQASFVYIVTTLSLKIDNPKQKIDNKKMSVENGITTQELDKINNFFNK